MLLMLMTASSACINSEAEDACKSTVLEECVISIPSSTSVTYKIISAFPKSCGLIGYHFMTHAIDFYDFDDCRLSKRLVLDKEGPNRIEQVRSLHAYSKDSIFLLTAQNIFIINEDGTIIRKIRINDDSSPIKHFDPTKHLIRTNPENNKPIFFDGHRIFVGLEPYMTKKGDQRYREVFKKIAGYIDLNTLVFEYLNIEISDQIIDSFYGALGNSSVNFSNDFAIVTFHSQYKFLSYIYSSQETIEYDFTSDFTASIAGDLPQEKTFTDNIDDIQRHFAGNPKFVKFRMNPYNLDLYQLHFAPSTKSQNMHENKYLSVFILDESGNYQKRSEFKVDHPDYMTKLLFPLCDGTLGVIKKPLLEDQLTLLKIDCR